MTRRLDGSRRHPGVVRRVLPRAHRRPGGRLGGDRRRAQRPGRRPHRLGQDARRVPLVDRPAGQRARPAEPQRRCRVLYVSPMKALAVDVERNLRAPLAGIRHAAARLGLPEPDLTVGDPVRRHPGRRAPAVPAHPARHPHHHARVAVPACSPRRPASRCAASRRSSSTRCTPSPAPSAAPTWRCPSSGSTHLLDAARPAHRAVGDGAPGRGGRPVPRRPARRRRSCSRRRPRRSSSRSSCPVEDMGELGQPTGEVSGSAGRARSAVRRSGRTSRSASSTWSQAHRSTIVFANSRRLAERLCARLNEID